MPAKILIIDDDKNLLRVTEYNLSDVGFMVDTAATGFIGLQKYPRQVFLLRICICHLLSERIYAHQKEASLTEYII